jgi:hypothetical protein
MARTERIWRVVATWPNGEVNRRRYLTPEAAEERRQRFAQGRRPTFSEAALAEHEANGTTPAPLEFPVVVVTPSYPVTYPKVAGDAATLPVPDASMSADYWGVLAQALGLAPDVIRNVEVYPDRLLVTYQPDPTEQAAPLSWVVEITGVTP